MDITRELLEACISQNRVAQKQLYLQLLPYLRAIANRYLRDTSYLKDALQESFVKIFNEIDRYDYNKAPIKNWAAKITINSCLNYNKRVIGLPKDELPVNQNEIFIMPNILDKMSKENLFHILKMMPSGFFEVFNLFIIDGYSHEEIATTLGISQDLSRKRMSRAREWLKNTFSENTHLIEEIKSSIHLN